MPGWSVSTEVSDVSIHVVRKQPGLLPPDLSCPRRLSTGIGWQGLKLLATLRAVSGFELWEVAFHLLSSDIALLFRVQTMKKKGRKCLHPQRHPCLHHCPQHQTKSLCERTMIPKVCSCLPVLVILKKVLVVLVCFSDGLFLGELEVARMLQASWWERECSHLQFQVTGVRVAMSGCFP